jgi:hypothetical protein
MKPYEKGWTVRLSKTRREENEEGSLALNISTSDFVPGDCTPHD